MTLRPLALLVIASSTLSGGAVAEDPGRGATQITANYGIYWAGLHFGDVRVVITVRSSDYQMKGDGRFSVLGGLIFEWRGASTSVGKLDKSGPKPSLYTLSYSGGDKHGDVRISFAGGAVTQVSTSPTKRVDPRDIPVTKEQLRGVLDPMTGAFLRARPNLSEADLKVCDETIPVFDGQIRFDIRGVRREVCPDLRLPARQSRRPIHVFAYRFDRALARAFAEDCAVCTLPNFTADSLRVWLGGIAFVPGGQGRSKGRLE
jgi:Protein of unknown function (DUF3108)